MWIFVGAIGPGTVFQYEAKYQAIITMNAFCGVVLDCTVAVSMCYFLAKRRDTVVRRSELVLFGLLVLRTYCYFNVPERFEPLIN